MIIRVINDEICQKNWGLIVYLEEIQYESQYTNKERKWIKRINIQTYEMIQILNMLKLNKIYWWKTREKNDHIIRNASLKGNIKIGIFL